MKPNSTIISIALIGLGVAGFVITTPYLHDQPEIDVPLNVLGIKRSPYGEVIAMAMQGPIDSYWVAFEDRSFKKPERDTQPSQSNQLKSGQKIAAHDFTGLNERVRLLLEVLSAGLEERTNAFAASDAHKFYLRRKVEGKLRFAYELDPAHYGNFIAYQFFLTEPQLGTRPELTPDAAKLAYETIRYCMNRRVDPREALTAASAAGNIIELMLNDRLHHENNVSRFSPAQMRDVLQVMDDAILLYLHLSDEWLEKGLWFNLSEYRITEANERFQFIRKIRESHEAAIQILENSALPDQPDQDQSH
jgi:hypothetical protein